VFFMQLHAAAIPACALTTFFMLGIEETGVQIEEPFSILALEVMAETIASNARVAREEAKVTIPSLVANSKAMDA
jgi:predicted membrane chloride channel (bestrophin family)